MMIFLMWFEIDIFGLVYPVGTFAVILGMGSLSYILGKRVKDKTLWWKVGMRRLNCSGITISRGDQPTPP